MVTFSNNVEPANGFLVRYLHRKMMESEDERNLTNEDLIQVLDWVPKLWYHLHTFLEKHSTSDFLIGMRKSDGPPQFPPPFPRVDPTLDLVSCRRLLRPVLFPLLPGDCGWVSIMVHWPLEPLHYSVPAGGGQGWHQGEKHDRRMEPLLFVRDQWSTDGDSEMCE